MNLQGFLDEHGSRMFYDTCKFVHDLETNLTYSVLRGAEWLDGEMPGWFEKIDLSDLQMHNGYKCICGQLWMSKEMQPLHNFVPYAGFTYAVEYHMDNDLDIATEYGFTILSLFSNDEYDADGKRVPEEGVSYNEAIEWDSLGPFMWETLAYEWGIQVNKRLANAGKL